LAVYYVHKKFCTDRVDRHSFIHSWHAPLGVHSAKRRHQSPEWTISSHANCFIEGEVYWI